LIEICLNLKMRHCIIDQVRVPFIKRFKPEIFELNPDRKISIIKYLTKSYIYEG